MDMEKLRSPIAATGSSTDNDHESKKRKAASGEAVAAENVIPSNKVSLSPFIAQIYLWLLQIIVDLIAIVKKHVLELIETINCVKVSPPY